MENVEINLLDGKVMKTQVIARISGTTTNSEFNWTCYSQFERNREALELDFIGIRKALNSVGVFYPVELLKPVTGKQYILLKLIFRDEENINAKELQEKVLNSGVYKLLK